MKRLSQLSKFSVAIALVLIFCSCASSERMVRMSGALGSYSAPERGRIEGGRYQNIDFAMPQAGSMINFWPLMYKESNYLSIIWPIFDYDKYGFAIRPLYNQEGNAYSILFPLSAWNPVKGDGWALSAYWDKDQIGVVPLFHHNYDAEGVDYYLLFWRYDDGWGVFPLLWVYDDLTVFLPVFWGADETNKLGGIFPIARFELGPDSFNYFATAWIDRGSDGNIDSYGVFPLFGDFGDFHNITLFYWRNGWNVFGFFPLFDIVRDDLSHAGLFWWDNCEDNPGYGLFPILAVNQNSLSYATLFWWAEDWQSYGLFPFARIKPKGLSYAGPLWWKGSGEDKTFGFFPLFRQSKNAGYFFPLYYYEPDFFRSILFGYGREDGKINRFNLLWALYDWRLKNYQNNKKSSLGWEYISKESNRLFLIAEHEKVTLAKPKNEFMFSELNRVGRSYFQIQKEDSKARMMAQFDQAAQSYEAGFPKLNSFEDYDRLKSHLIDKYTSPATYTQAKFLPLFEYSNIPDDKKLSLLFSIIANAEKNNKNTEKRKTESKEFSILLGSLFDLDKSSSLDSRYFERYEHKSISSLLLFSSERKTQVDLKKSLDGNSALSDLLEKFTAEKVDQAEIKSAMRNLELQSEFPDNNEKLFKFTAELLDKYGETTDEATSMFFPLYYTHRENQDKKWNILGFLARHQSDGTNSDTRVLEFFYRHRSDGVNSSTLIFPGVVIENGEKSNGFSFLWRVFNYQNDNGKRSGHIFFIPW